MATAQTRSVAPAASTPPSRVQSSWLRANWGLLLAIAALIVIAMLPTPDGLPVAGQRMLALLAFAVIVWMTEALDYAVSAVVIAALMALLLGFSPNVANPNALYGTSAGLTTAFSGFANTALEWGGSRWTTVVWRMVPADAHARARMFLHELFHRIQPQLGFMIADGRNDHLDTLEGRYWMQLEWRALSKALGASGEKRVAALRDALSFRAERRRRFPGAAENERPLEMNEGLAQYTGTVAAAASAADAVADELSALGTAFLLLGDLGFGARTIDHGV